MNCNDISKMISPFIDGELSGAELDAFTAHIDGCDSCRAELKAMQNLGALLRGMGAEDIAPPPQFGDQVLSRIAAESKPQGVKRFWNWGSGIAAAAILLLSIASYNAIPRSDLQVANTDNKPGMVEKSSAKTEVPAAVKEVTGVDGGADSRITNDKTAFQVDIQQTGGVEPAGGAPLNIASSAANNGAPVTFLSRPRTLVTTMLTIKVNDCGQAQNAVLKMADKAGANVEVLGQQSIASKQYLASKITVPTFNVAGLMLRLAELGSVENQEQTKEDIGSRFEQTYEQYRAVNAELASAVDSEQRARLEKQAKALEDQLTAWDKQASVQTIVLWLEQ